MGNWAWGSKGLILLITLYNSVQTDFALLLMKSVDWMDLIQSSISQVYIDLLEIDFDVYTFAFFFLFSQEILQEEESSALLEDTLKKLKDYQLGLFSSQDKDKVAFIESKDHVYISTQ